MTLATKTSSATGRTMHHRHSLSSVLVLGGFLSGCVTPAVAQITNDLFEQDEVVTGPAKRQTVLTGHALVPATVFAPPASGELSAGSSNVTEPRATPGHDEIDLFMKPRFDNRTFALATPAGIPRSSFRRDDDEVHGDSAKRELKRHHIGIQAGIFNPSTDVIELEDANLDVEGNRFVGALNIPSYRYSLSPFIDVAVDLVRHWIGRWPSPASQGVKVAGGYIGPGIRVNGLDRTKGSRVIPYLQGNIYLVQEQLTTSEETFIEYGVGFGFSGGVDLAISRLISIPIEATYVVTGGDKINDLSGFGLFVGVNFNF